MVNFFEYIMYTRMLDIHIYSKPKCVNCDTIKEILTNNSFEFTQSTHSSLYDLIQTSNLDEDTIISIGTFPIINYNNQYFGYKHALHIFDEDILLQNKNRFSLYPIEHGDIFEMYKKARSSYWQPDEISLKDDLKDWNLLSKDEQKFISYILAFFSASDGIVNENLNLNFCTEVQYPEARSFYTFQEAIESIHSETYGLILDKYIDNPIEKEFLQKGIQTIPSIKVKADWALKWTNNKNIFAERLVAYACVEGIMFSGSFCAIFWLKKRGILPGLCFSNELISRDEGLHTEFAILLYTKYTKHKLTRDCVENIVKEAVECEKSFIIESIPCKLIGMNSGLMCQYIEYVGDRLLIQLGYSKIWNVQLPQEFSFMETISLSGKTNFFEKRVGEYSKASISKDELKFDADF